MDSGLFCSLKKHAVSARGNSGQQGMERRVWQAFICHDPGVLQWTESLNAWQT